MDVIKKKFVGNCHCPYCNSMYIIIDNEIISCPGCDLSLMYNKLNIFEEEDARKEIVQYQT